MCVVLSVTVREREKMTKRAPNVRPLSVWSPKGLPARAHLFSALNAVSNSGLHCKSQHFKADSRGKIKGEWRGSCCSHLIILHLFMF